LGGIHEGDRGNVAVANNARESFHPLLAVEGRALAAGGPRPRGAAVAARLYRRYRAWIADVIRCGVDSGEFRDDVNVAAAADIATAMLDGAGVRMLIRDPAMQLERTRAIVAETLARELGVGPGVLASSRDQ
jgi:BetI-type transcriptional repressor, C-terminal